jgi:hypothetical protein
VLIDCDTCTVRGPGCDDCVVTVLLGAPPGWQETAPTVVPLTRRPRAAGGTSGSAPGDVSRRVPGAAPAAVRGAQGRHGGSASRDAPGGEATGGDLSPIDESADRVRPVVDLDEVERRAVGALAQFGLVPPLRHQDASAATPTEGGRRNRHVS